MSIFLVQHRLWMPRAAAGKMLTALARAMCVGCDAVDQAPFIDFRMAFYTNDVEITDEVDVADYTFSANILYDLNGEAEPAYCDGFVQGPSLQTDGEWALIFDQVAMLNGAGPQTIYGGVLLGDPSGTPQLWGVSRFDVPVTLVTGDTLKASGLYTLLPQVPELDV